MLERARLLHAQVYRQLHGTDEPGNCQLLRAPGKHDYIGSCGALFQTGDDAGAPVRLRLQETAAIASGAWNTDESPATVFAGQLVDASTGDNAIELEASLNRDGVLRTQHGWFAVTGVILSDDQSRLSLRVAADQPIAANATDIAILTQAKALLSDSSHWDRNDDRKCTGQPGFETVRPWRARAYAGRVHTDGPNANREQLVVREERPATSIACGLQQRQAHTHDRRASLLDGPSRSRVRRRLAARERGSDCRLVRESPPVAANGAWGLLPVRGGCLGGFVAGAGSGGQDNSTTDRGRQAESGKRRWRARSGKEFMASGQ